MPERIDRRHLLQAAATELYSTWERCSASDLSKSCQQRIRDASDHEVACGTKALRHVWRIGGVALLAILAIALTHHALAGNFAASPLFASLVVMLDLADERRDF